ncbi:hypothetical protein D3C71_2038500 [compost metagenome]
MAEDGALAEWLDSFPATDSQQIRALIRQARKDVPAGPAVDAEPAEEGAPSAPRKVSRAYRELFALLREQLSGSQGFRGAPQAAAPAAADDDSDE